jgi:hypothetical protein
MSSVETLLLIDRERALPTQLASAWLAGYLWVALQCPTYLAELYRLVPALGVRGHVLWRRFEELHLLSQKALIFGENMLVRTTEH